MDAAYVEALFAKRIAFAKQLREQLETSNSVAQQTLELYSTILDEIILEVVAEVHREVKTGSGEVCRQDLRAKEYKIPVARVPKTGLDLFGNSDATSLSEEVTCNNCGRRVAAPRFAPHLEKCMGKGRNASRAAYRT